MRSLQRPGWLFAAALYAAAALGYLILWLASGPSTAQATPTAVSTADNRPQTATLTLTVIPTSTAKAPTPATTHTPVPTATAELATAELATAGPVTHVPGTATATPTAPIVTPIPTVTPPIICRTGVITAHAAMEAVLANRPERRCQDCVYFASVLCQDIGERLTLRAAGVTLPVVVVDCATWSVGRWPQKLGEDWLGELDIRAWPEAPLAPLKAELCRTGAEYGASD